MNAAVMPSIPVAAGIALGGLNYLLLALACRRLLRREPAGAVLLLAALAVPVTGLALCAWRCPAALAYLGVSCAAALTLLALAGGAVSLLRNKKP